MRTLPRSAWCQPIALVFITIFVVVVLTILLHLLRNFFWRICVLENAGVRESLQRGFAMVLENWKNVGLMWLVMIGLGIVWAIASIILFIVTIPLVIVTAVIAVARSGGPRTCYWLAPSACSSTASCRGLQPVCSLYRCSSPSPSHPGSCWAVGKQCTHPRFGR